MMWKFIERVLWEMTESCARDDDCSYYGKQGYLDSILTFIPYIMEDPEFPREEDSDSVCSFFSSEGDDEGDDEDNNNPEVENSDTKIAEMENGPSMDESQRPKSVILKIEVDDEEKEKTLQLEDEGEAIPLILRENPNRDQLDGQETKPSQDVLHDDRGESASLI